MSPLMVRPTWGQGLVCIVISRGQSLLSCMWHALASASESTYKWLCCRNVPLLEQELHATTQEVADFMKERPAAGNKGTSNAVLMLLYDAAVLLLCCCCDAVVLVQELQEDTVYLMSDSNGGVPLMESGAWLHRACFSSFCDLLCLLPAAQLPSLGLPCSTRTRSKGSCSCHP